MPNIRSVICSAFLAGGLAAACNAPKQTAEETRMYPKAPLTQMAPVIKGEPSTAMSRLARFHKPPVVVIPAESPAAGGAKK